MISWITIVIRSTPRDSIRARAPWLRAIIRFWISVESLNRPPTLLTISSSFNSSIIVFPRSTTPSCQDRGEVLECAVEFVVDHVDIVAFRRFELAASVGKAALDGGLVIGSSRAQPGSEAFQTRWLDKNQECARHLALDLEPPLDI